MPPASRIVRGLFVLFCYDCTTIYPESQGFFSVFSKKVFRPPAGACFIKDIVVQSQENKRGFVMAKQTEAQKRATEKYQKANTIQVKFTLNKKTDSDIIEKLESVENKQGYFKELVRADIAGRQEAGERRQ